MNLTPFLRIHYAYDADGLLMQIEQYDAQGQLIQKTAQQHDARHRLTENALYDSSVPDAVPPVVSRNQWDANGNLSQSTDPNGRVTQNHYDAANRLVESLDPLNGLTAYGFDDRDHTSQITAPNRAATRYQYDGNGRQTQENGPDRGPLSTQYDNNSNLTEQNYANGAKIQWTYDALNRVQTEIQTEPDQTQTTVHYTYDTCAIGKLCSINDDAQQTTFHYDGFGQLVQETRTQDGQTAQTGYAYDSAGRLQQLTYSSGRTVTYQRDALGRIERIDTVVNGQPQTVVEQLRYGADNQIEQLRYGNGIEERRQYNGLGRLIQQTLTDANGQTVKEQTYQYDNAGNIVKRQTQGLSQFPLLTATYQYDSLDRLTQESYGLFPERTAIYTFDANGNRLTKLQGQVETEISEIYRYQPNSNRMIDKDVLRQDTPAPEPIKDIEYDAKQRIRKLFVDSKLKAEYRYDIRNLRTKKTLYDINGTIAEEIYYHYDQNGLLIGESDAQGQAKREYVYLDGVPVGQIDIDNQAQESIVYLHADHLATPRLATNQSKTIVWKWESDAYGAISPQGSVTINLRFPGQYFDQESGWFYNWNRYYDSERGRYLTSDPIGLRGGLNAYVYVRNNTLTSFDMYGLYAFLNCNEKQRRRIDAAVEKARKASKCLNCDEDMPNNSDEFEKVLNVVTFKCANKTIMPNPEYITCAINAEPVGAKDFVPHNIVLSNEVLGKGCQCLESVIFHEVLHSYPFHYREKQAFQKQSECFKCAKLPTDEEFDNMYSHLK